MKILDVTPRTPAWHEIRAEKWTASTGAMLVVPENAMLIQRHALKQGVTLDIEPLLRVGLADYFNNTPWKIWAEKFGQLPAFKGNEHTARGTANETLIVNLLEKQVGQPVMRDVTAVSTENPWLLASFDGFLSAESDTTTHAPYGFPVEAKCPAFPSRKKLWESKSSGKLAVLGLPYYWVQIQHQILVADSPYGWFVAAGVEKNKEGVDELMYPLIEKVPRDYKFLKAYQAIAQYYFETFIDKCLEPEKLPADHQLLDSLAAKAQFSRAIESSDNELAVNLYLDALKAEAEAANRRKDLEAQLLAAAEKMREEGADMVLLANKLQIQYSSSKTVSWQKVAKTLGDSVDKDTLNELVSKCTSTRSAVKIKEVS